MPAMAQYTLSGTVVSKTDGAPIEMATVRLFAYPKNNMPAPLAGMPAPPEGMPMPPEYWEKGQIEDKEQDENKQE